MPPPGIPSLPSQRSRWSAGEAEQYLDGCRENGGPGGDEAPLQRSFYAALPARIGPDGWPRGHDGAYPPRYDPGGIDRLGWDGPAVKRGRIILTALEPQVIKPGRNSA